MLSFWVLGIYLLLPLTPIPGALGQAPKQQFRCVFLTPSSIPRIARSASLLPGAPRWLDLLPRRSICSSVALPAAAAPGREWRGRRGPDRAEARVNGEAAAAARCGWLGSEGRGGDGGRGVRHGGGGGVRHVCSFVYAS
jgi:hypothetical protein